MLERKTHSRKNFISTLRNHTSYKISGNYLTFYNGSIARLVFAKIISDGEESTIIKRSYKVDPVYYNKGGRKYLKLHDFVSQTNIYIEKLQVLVLSLDIFTTLK